MKKLIVPSAILAAGVAFLVGCGDENNTNEITQVVGMQVLDKGVALPKCTADNEGAMVYSVDSAEAFCCVSRKWTTMKGEKGEDGKKDTDGESGSAGADGKDGKDGKNGKDGSSCTAKALKDGKGYKIVCGGDSVGVVMSGAEGAQGIKGDSGATGDNGLSAYEIAKAGGYTGTEEQWIASLKGEQGVKGDSGVSGTSCTAEEDSAGVKITCTDGKTFTLSNGADGAAGTSCTATKLEGDAGIEIKCGETVVDTVKNGAKGDKGDKGADGAAGTSCTATKLEGDAGIEIKCGETVVDTVKNGAKGDPGAAGTSCTAEEVTGGVKITCTDGKTYTLNNGADGKDGRNFDEGWMVDHRDYHIYKIVTIGTQTWMAENLNYETEMGSYCYKDSAKYCEKYGRLYTWATAVGKSEEDCGFGKECNLGDGKVRGVCPEGWHLPTQTEWNTLFTAVGGRSTAGKMLKSTSGWNSSGNGTDAYSFSALPAGLRNNTGNYDDEGYGTDFWSSTENGSNNAYLMDLYYFNDDADLFNYLKNHGFSVRCVKD